MLKHHLSAIAFTCIVIAATATHASAKVKIKKLFISTQMAGWTEEKATTRSFSPQQLFDIINGGAEEYINRGLIGGIHQQFSSDNGKTFEVFVEDFGDTTKSATMLAAKKESFTETAPMADLADIPCFSSRAIGAVIVIASIGRFYIEMTASGFTEAADAEKAAIDFVGYYRKIIGS